jgi:hypothetical protein
MPEVENNQTPTTNSAATTTTVETPSVNTSSPAPVETAPVTEAPKIAEPPKSALDELGALKDKPVQAADDKKLDPKTDAPPAEYELTLSDKSPLDEKDLDEVVSLAEKYKWTKEEAEAYITKKEDIYNRGIEGVKKQAENAINAEKEKFLKDPDFKGDKLVDSLNSIDLVVSKYGDADLRAYLKGPGGNSLALAKMLLRVGNLMKSDTMQGKGTSTPEPKGDSREQALSKLYPSFFDSAN